MIRGGADTPGETVVGAPGAVSDRDEDPTAPRPGPARERVLEVLDDLGLGAGDEFAMGDVYRHLGIAVGTKEHRAVQRAIDRMYRGDRGREPELERVKVGRYRRI